VLNRIVLIGRLTRDPELRYVPSGHPVASFTLAVDRPFVNQQGERGTDFIDVVAWRRLAEQVTQHLNKGRLVAVEGRLQIRSYETQDGQKRRSPRSSPTAYASWTVKPSERAQQVRAQR